MIDCANTVLYNMENALSSSGWDPAAAVAAADFVAAAAASHLDADDAVVTDQLKCKPLVR